MDSVLSDTSLKINKRKATSQVVEGLPEGDQRALPPPNTTHISIMTPNKEDPVNAGINQDKFMLHPDDPRNFLKLCAAIHVLLHRHLTDDMHCTRLVTAGAG